MRLSTRTPATTGISAAAIWPSSFGSAGGRGRRRARRPRRSPPRRAGSRGSRFARQPDPAGHLDRDQDRQPGEPRHRSVVQAARLRQVDRADPEGELLGVGDQQPGDRRGGDEGEDGVGGRQAMALPWEGPDQATGRPSVGARSPRQPRARPRPGGRGRAGGGRRPGSRLRSSSAAGSARTRSRPSAISASSTAAHAAGEGGEDGRAEGDRLAVHRPPRADHEVGVGDQALGVDRPLGDDQVGAPSARTATPCSSVRGMTTA